MSVLLWSAAAFILYRIILILFETELDAMSGHQSRSTTRRNGPRVYAFGSCTPRYFEYMDNIPHEYRIYDVQLKSRPRNGPTLVDYMQDARELDGKIVPRDRSLDSSLARSRLYAFGSSTPRDFSHLDKLDKEWRVYDVRLKPINGDKRSRTTHSFTSTPRDKAANPSRTRDEPLAQKYIRRTSSMSKLPTNSAATSSAPKQQATKPRPKARVPPSSRAPAKVNNGTAHHKMPRSHSSVHTKPAPPITHKTTTKTTTVITNGHDHSSDADDESASARAQPVSIQLPGAVESVVTTSMLDSGVDMFDSTHKTHVPSEPQVFDEEQVIVEQITHEIEEAPTDEHHHQAIEQVTISHDQHEAEHRANGTRDSESRLSSVKHSPHESDEENVTKPQSDSEDKPRHAESEDKALENHLVSDHSDGEPVVVVGSQRQEKSDNETAPQTDDQSLSFVEQMQEKLDDVKEAIEDKMGISSDNEEEKSPKRHDSENSQKRQSVSSAAEEPEPQHVIPSDTSETGQHASEAGSDAHEKVDFDHEGHKEQNSGIEQANAESDRKAENTGDEHHFMPSDNSDGELHANDTDKNRQASDSDSTKQEEENPTFMDRIQDKLEDVKDAIEEAKNEIIGDNDESGKSTDELNKQPDSPNSQKRHSTASDSSQKHAALDDQQDEKTDSEDEKQHIADNSEELVQQVTTTTTTTANIAHTEPDSFEHTHSEELDVKGDEDESIITPIRLEPDNTSSFVDQVFQQSATDQISPRHSKKDDTDDEKSSVHEKHLIDDLDEPPAVKRTYTPETMEHPMGYEEHQSETLINRPNIELNQANEIPQMEAVDDQMNVEHMRANENTFNNGFHNETNDTDQDAGDIALDIQPPTDEQLSGDEQPIADSPAPSPVNEEPDSPKSMSFTDRMKAKLEDVKDAIEDVTDKIGLTTDSDEEEHRQALVNKDNAEMSDKLSSSRKASTSSSVTSQPHLTHTAADLIDESKI